MTAQKTILSGIQPTNEITLGNYLGALKKLGKTTTAVSLLLCLLSIYIRSSPNEAELTYRPTVGMHWLPILLQVSTLPMPACLSSRTLPPIAS